MNERDREELRKLQEQQDTLRLQLTQLDTQLRSLAERMEMAAKEFAPLPITPLEMPPLAEPGEEHRPAPEQIAIPPVIASFTAPTPAAAKPASPETATTSPIPETLGVMPPAPVENIPAPPVFMPPVDFSHVPKSESVPPSPEPEKKSGSFEMRLGTYWLVRIGIVVVLTGLAFLGNYAYVNWIADFGPVGKTSLLYFASALLLGFGAWFQRKEQKESLKNYANVLFAGGLASVYFTTYAGHYIEPLRIIESPLGAGLLLFGWAAFMVGLADRKKSEVLALFATGLAYYTSLITKVGEFTLYSNLILTIASVFFLVRNRWTTLSFGSLIATYAGFGFWRFFNHGWMSEWTLRDLWIGNYFLAGYWIVFTAAVFLSRNEKFTGAARAIFASMNNGAFFGLVVASMLRHDHGYFWKFSLGFGVALLALTVLAKRFLPQETALRNNYLTQGLVFATLGFIAHFSGLKLALILAAESVILLTLGLRQKNLILQAGACLAAVLSMAWLLTDIHAPTTALMGAAVGSLILFNSFWASRTDTESDSFLRPTPTFFALIGLFVWLITTWHHAPAGWLPPALALQALVLTASIYLLRVREIAFLAQAYLVLAQLRWIHDSEFSPGTIVWWSPAIIIACTVALMHWWQRQQALPSRKELRIFFQGTYSLATIGLLNFWLRPHFEPGHWMAFTSLLAIGITVYGIVTRAWLLAGAGQIFLAISIFEFARQLAEGYPNWYFALAPIATLLLLGFGVATWLLQTAEQPSDDEAPVRKPLLNASMVYRWIATFMSLWWIHEYIPMREQFWVLMLVGTAIFFAGTVRKTLETLSFSAVFYVTGLITFVFLLPSRGEESVYWPNLFAILTLPALQQWIRKHPETIPLSSSFHVGMIVPGCLCLWVLVSRWVQVDLALFWTLLAIGLIAAEILLREKTYQWVGVGILVVALAHVVLLDAWKREVFWPNLLPILSVLVLHQLSKRFPTRYNFDRNWLGAMILVGGGSLWLFLSRAVILESGGYHFFLTASWAGLALGIFTLGLVLRERLYRWLGLGILGCALGRIFLSDIWRLNTGYRILSFLALGGALLILGFFYNKYQEKIREWI